MIEVLGGGQTDGSLGISPDFSKIKAPLGRVLQSLSPDGKIDYWVVETTDKGGEILADGNYANPVSVAGSSLDNANVIKAILVSEGLSGNYGFFGEGFTYSVEGDIGIDSDGNSWIYVGAGAPNKVVTAGTVPSVVGGYEQVTFNSLSAINVINENGGSVQDFIDNLSGYEVLDSRGTNVQDYIDGNLTPFKTVADMKAAAYLSTLPEFTRIEWQGYYTQSDGGGNRGVLRFGSHTEDGGSIFSIDANTYIEANLKGKTINVKKFGADPSIINNSPHLQATVDFCASRPKGRASVYIPYGDFSFSDQITWRTQVSAFGDGKVNTRLRWDGDDNTWAIMAEDGGCYDLKMSDFAIFGPEFTATKRLLNTRKFRYSTFENLWMGDCLVCNVTGDCWGSEYVHCSFTPRISSPSESYSGCVGVWVEDGTLGANAQSYRHCRFQFAEIGLLVKSGGRAYSVTDANIFESCDVGIKIQNRFIRNFNIVGNYFEFLRLGPVWLERSGMAGWINGLNVKDNYMICNASEFAVFKMTGTDAVNRSSVVIENNAVEFSRVDHEPTSGYFLHTPDGTVNCSLTYNQEHIVNPFNNTEVYTHYNKDLVYLPSFNSNVPFELDYTLDDQGVNKFKAQNLDVLVGIPSNGQLRIIGTVTSTTQSGNGSVTVAKVPASATTGTNTSFFSFTSSTSSSVLRGARSGQNLDLSALASGAVGRVDFTYAMKNGNFIVNSVG